MNDVFKEQIVKRESTIKDTIIKAGAVALGMLLVIVCMNFEFLIPFISFIVIGIGFGVYFLFTRLNVEYEYIFTNGELDIDTIYNRSRRKRVFSGDAKNFEIFAHMDDKAHESSFGKAELVNYSSGKIKNNTYAFLATYKGKKLKIVIEPNETMLKSMSSYLGQRKYLKV